MISAYLDPASGSAIIGAVAAGGAGIAVAGRAVLAKLGFGKNKSSDETPIHEETDETPIHEETDETPIHEETDETPIHEETDDSEGVGETDEITQ